ncbi:MAG: transketolase [Ignavibacteria bacterium]|nr:transketolase [Ignavibacteria bacterium]
MRNTDHQMQYSSAIRLGVPEVEEMARQIRRDIIKMLLISRSGHSGGPLGLADVFSSLYFNVLRYDPRNPNWPGRDYFFLSAGHLAPVWYATLARAGFFPLHELTTLRKINTRLQGHPAPGYTHGLPGIEIASGSLGQGMSIAVGCALGLRMDKKPNRVYVLHGDGELDEGQVWEGIMSAGHYTLDNLTAVVDRNFCQIDNRTDKVMEIEPLADKWRSFRWNVIECDGNDVNDFLGAIDRANAYSGKPSVVIAKTFMGKGVSFMEDDYRWHGIPPNEEQGKQALSELAPTTFGDFIEFEWERETVESTK